MTDSTTDREQIRRDAEAFKDFAEGSDERILARHCLALLAEVEQAERERESLIEQRWSNQNRAEVAERGHKACLARDSDHRDRIKSLERERDERERAAVMEGERRIAALEARLAKVPALVENAKPIVEVLKLDTFLAAVVEDAEFAPYLDVIEEHLRLLDDALADWEQASSNATCENCNGHGFQAGAHTERVEPCPACGGTGSAGEQP